MPHSITWFLVELWLLQCDHLELQFISNQDRHSRHARISNFLGVRVPTKILISQQFVRVCNVPAGLCSLGLLTGGRRLAWC